MKIKTTTTLEERNEAYEVRKAVFVDEQKVPLELELDEFEETSIHFVCYDDGAAVGVSRLRLFPEYGKLERIAVLKAHRGKSIGRKLIQKMEAEIAKHHINKAKLSAQTHAIGFYEMLGYQVISEQYMDAGIPHVTMTKHLDSINSESKS